MPAHVAWKGHLRLSLVSIPLRAYTAANYHRTPIALHQLHAPCHNRIRYRKTCPEHGDVPAHEIVKGYEFEKNQYVIVDDDELDRRRTEQERSIALDAFVPAGAIEPTCFAGRTYYLLPEGAIGDKPYALLRQVMEEKGVCGLGQAVISSREHVVMVRPRGRLLLMHILEYAEQVKSPGQFEDEAPDNVSSKEELKLTRMLVEAMEREEADLERYRDVYYDRLRELIEAKIEGRELVAPREAEPVPVVNFIDALKASMREVRPAGARRKSASKSTARPRELRAAAKRSPAKKRKRKSG